MSDNTITVRFFARLREDLKTDQLAIDARPGLTAGDVLAELASQGGPWDQSVSYTPLTLPTSERV